MPAGRGKWTATAPSAWQSLRFISHVGCPLVSPVSGGTFTVQLALTPVGMLHVEWATDASGGMATAAIDCPPQGGEPP